jgi:hypothetical protein
MEVDLQSNGFAIGASTDIVSLPDTDAPTQIAATPKAVDKGKSRLLRSTTSRSSPLSRSVTTASLTPSSPKDDYIRKGRESAADIMQHVIEEELGIPLNSAKPVEPMFVNPYESTNSTPRSPARTPAKGTPRKSALRASVRGATPTRGAAEKLEKFKSVKKLTTLEILRGETTVG